MATTTTTNNNNKIPKRPFGSILKDKDNLSKELSIIGLGCSSFSSFFDEESSSFDLQNLSKSHPLVQEWIQTIRYAVLEAGINLLDTAPWYGHGTSEVVVGWALEELLLSENEQVDDGREGVQSSWWGASTGVLRNGACSAEQCPRVHEHEPASNRAGAPPGL